MRSRFQSKQVIVKNNDIPINFDNHVNFNLVISYFLYKKFNSLSRVDRIFVLKKLIVKFMELVDSRKEFSKSQKKLTEVMQ